MGSAWSREWKELVHQRFRRVLDREAQLEAAEARTRVNPDDPGARQALEEARFNRDRALSSLHSLVIPKLRSRVGAELGQAGQDAECIAHDAVTSLCKHRARLERSAWGYLLAVVRNQSRDLKKELLSRIPFEEKIAEASRAFKRKRELLETKELINEWSATLDDQMQDILTAWLQDLSIAEVASRLRISRSTVKRRYSALKASLRAWLEARNQ